MSSDSFSRSIFQFEPHNLITTGCAFSHWLQCERNLDGERRRASACWACTLQDVERKKAERTKGTIMTTLKVLTAAAGILLAVSGPSLAAKRVQHNGYSAYASGAVNADRSGAYNYGPVGGKPVLTPAQHNYNAV